MKRKSRKEEAPATEVTAEEETPKKKQKIVYIDDGSQIADMSATRRHGKTERRRSTAREKVKTYFSVVKRMLIPMFCTLLAFALVLVILLALTGNL